MWIFNLYKKPKVSAGQANSCHQGSKWKNHRAVWGPLNSTIISCGEDAIIRVWDPVVLSLSSKSDNKRAIEQLVTEETYSRKEANELIKLVRSRIVDSNATFGETTPNMWTSAIMEARKWLQEKRSGSKKKFEIELDSANVASPFQLWSPFSMLLLLNSFSGNLSPLLSSSPWLQL